MSKEAENTKILEVIVDGTAFRCEETQRQASDERGEPYIETSRSKWLSKAGVVGDDIRCVNALSTQKRLETQEALRKRLWEK